MAIIPVFFEDCRMDWNSQNAASRPHGILPLMHPYSIYLHAPFCRHRCSYCDFNTYAGLDDIIPGYVSALAREIDLLASGAGMRLPVHTLFFGGGTPSLLSIRQLESLLGALESGFDLLPGLEATLEANPGTVSLPYLKDLRALRINRLSLGMQSANPGELRLLEREHEFEDVQRAVEWARAAGFDSINLDLIFGLPYQNLVQWKYTLDQALALRPEHLALYALTLEHGTPLHNQVGKGLLPEPDSDVAADMYEYASEQLSDSGYRQYEISNWALEDNCGKVMACRHNLQYWRNLPYLGLGAGAHGFAGGFRTANVLAPGAYIQRLSEGKQPQFPRTPASAEVRPIDAQTEIAETMIMGLRLTQEGVSARAFAARFGAALPELFGKQIERLCASGLLEWAGDQGDILRLTTRGRLLGNRVFIEFL